MIIWALIFLWILTAILIFLAPFSIALFYQRTFRKATYPYLFLLVLFMYSASLAGANLQSFKPADDLFLILGGVALMGASLRLYQVMMGRKK